MCLDDSVSMAACDRFSKRILLFWKCVCQSLMTVLHMQCFRRKTVRNRLQFFFSILAGFKVLVGFCAGCWMVLGGFQAGLGLFCVVLVLVLVVLLWLRLLFSKILVCFDGFWIVLGCFEGLVCGVVFVGFCLQGLFFGLVLGLFWVWLVLVW